MTRSVSYHLSQLDYLTIQSSGCEYYYEKTSKNQNGKYLRQVKTNPFLYTLICITYIVWFNVVDELLVR